MKKKYSHLDHKERTLIYWWKKERAELLKANLEGAYLSLAKMKESRNLSQAQIDNAYYFEELGPPELPEGLKLPQAKNLEN